MLAGRIFKLVIICGAILALGAGILRTAPLVGVESAQANSALGCSFDAYSPWSSGTRTYANLWIKCNQSRWLIVRGRITRQKTLWPDKTVGNYDGWVYLNAGQWAMIRVAGSCDGHANYFAKAVIQANTLSTAYTDRSATVAAC
jgi:hypothetical protein